MGEERNDGWGPAVLHELHGRRGMGKVVFRFRGKYVTGVEQIARARNGFPAANPGGRNPRRGRGAPEARWR